VTVRSDVTDFIQSYSGNPAARNYGPSTAPVGEAFSDATRLNRLSLIREVPHWSLPVRYVFHL